MALLKIKKASLIAHATSRSAVMKLLQEIGAVEITAAKLEDINAASAPVSLSDLETGLGDVREALAFLKRFDENKAGFLTPKPAISRSELKNMTDRFSETDAVIKRVKQYITDIAALKAQKQRLNLRIAQIAPFERFDAPLETIGTGRFTTSMLGTLPNTAAEKYEQLTQNYADNAYFETIDASTNAIYIVMSLDMADAITSELKALGFTEAYTKDLTGTPSDAILRFNEKINEINSIIADSEENAKTFVEHKALLQALEDFLLNEIDRERSIEKLGETGETFILEGWVLAEDQDRLEKTLSQTAPEAYITFRDPLDEESPPTAIRNKKLVEPFEAVTNLYSAPSYRGVDPNFMMSIFYFIIFGMMIGDFAYGVILTIGTYLVLRLKRPTGMFRQVTTVIMICGISTAFWGLFFGTIFSIPGIPAILNPLEDAMTMLILCLGIGVVHLLFGLGMGVYANIKQGNVFGAIFDNASWMFVLIGAVMLILGGILGIVGNYLILAGVAMLLVSQLRQKKNVFKAITGWLGGLYGATGYLSDVLSYARIFAMGLATSVIAMVFNTIAGLFFGNVVGFIIGAVVMTIGHVFNIAINTLGAFVHTARLQYIEFYSKFYETGGHMFAPLGIKTKNYRLED